MAMIKAVRSRVYSKSQEHGHKRNLRMCKMPGSESSTMFLQLQRPREDKSLAEGHTASSGITGTENLLLEFQCFITYIITGVPTP